MAHSEAIRPRDDASWLGHVVLGRVRTLPLPQDALRTSLVIMLLLAPQLACIEFDVAWHNSPLRKFPFLGLPHPWTLEHLGIVLPVPLTFLLLARLQAPESAQTGLKMLRFRGVSRPTGAFVSLAGWLLLGFGLLFDGAWHALSGQRAEGGVVAFPHLVIQFAGVLALFGSMLLLYDLATGPALGDNQSQRLLARGALLLSLVWLMQSLAMIFPFTPHAYGPHTEAAWTTITLSACPSTSCSSRVIRSRSSTAIRSGRGKSSRASAAFAAATARSTSAGPQAGTTPSTPPSYGDRTSRVPSDPSVNHAPSTYASAMLRG